MLAPVGGLNCHGEPGKVLMVSESVCVHVCLHEAVPVGVRSHRELGGRAGCR